MMHYYYNGYYPSYMWGFGSILTVIFWVFVIYILFMILKGRKTYESRHGHKEDPIEILKIRFAKGDITKEQFESMKKELS